MKMHQRLRILAGSLLLILLVMNMSGCIKFFGPSDEEIIKAISEMEVFSGGVEKFKLKSPIVIVHRGMFSSRGGWTVKVRMNYTYTMAGGQETKPMEKVQTFIISKSQDSAGKTQWKATAGPK